MLTTVFKLPPIARSIPAASFRCSWIMPCCPFDLISERAIYSAGDEAPHAVRSAEKNRFEDLMVVSEVITDGTDWKTHWRNKLGALR
jgi:hypothetical protein